MIVDRRDALKRLALGGAAAATLPTWVETVSALAIDHAHSQARTAARTAAWKPRILTAHQNQTVVALSELIIPQTTTAGAKAARVNEFIDGVLADASADTRTTFLDGLAWIDARIKTDGGSTFVAATPDQQTALLTTLSQAQFDRATAVKDSSSSNVAMPDAIGVDFFEAIKSMTIIGYYTSEVGTREELGDDGTMFFAEFKGCTHPEHLA